MNVALNPGFTQVCTWPGTLVGADNAKEFEQFILDDLGARVQYLEEVYTAADSTGPGGRCDVLFAVHDEDVGKFALARLQYGMRWLEDVYGNGHGHLYPERVAGYKCWSEEEA